MPSARSSQRLDGGVSRRVPRVTASACQVAQARRSLGSMASLRVANGVAESTVSHGNSGAYSTSCGGGSPLPACSTASARGTPARRRRVTCGATGATAAARRPPRPWPARSGPYRVLSRYAVAWVLAVTALLAAMAACAAGAGVAPAGAARARALSAAAPLSEVVITPDFARAGLATAFSTFYMPHCAGNGP